jgi:TetR/AcrR family transcriptional regulator
VTRHRDPDATRSAILDAAEAIFLEKGFGNTATSEIAARAGVTKSLIHHHFGSKDGLWREVKTRRFVDYGAKQLEMMRDTPATLGLLRDSFEFYFRFMEANPQLVRILAWLFLEGDKDDCADLDRELMAAGIAKLREGQEAGYLRKDVDARFMLFVFIGLAQHWFQDCPHFLNSFDRTGLPEDLNTAYMQDAAKIFLEGVLPRTEALTDESRRS